MNPTLRELVSPDGEVVLLFSFVDRNWARIYISANGLVCAASDYGSFQAYWTHPGYNELPPLQRIARFLCDAESSPDYFTNRFADGRQVYDGTATLRSIRFEILDQRRHLAWDAAEARQEWEGLDRFDIEGSKDEFERWLAETQISDAYEHHCQGPPPMASLFVEEVVIRRLVPLLRAWLEEQASAQVRT